MAATSERPAGPRECSVAAALDLIGERWSLLVIRELLLGVRRFNDIAANTGAPRDVLTVRLRRLEDAGVIERRPYSDRPVRYEYRLTQAGRDLQPIVLSLKAWGDKHVRHRRMPPVWEHVCGEAFEPQTCCTACGEPLRPRELTLRTPRRVGTAGVERALTA